MHKTIIGLLGASALLCAPVAYGAVFGPDGEQPYVYDYFERTDPASFLASYKGEAFKTHTLKAGEAVKVEAEYFDKGNKGEVWNFKYPGASDLRPGEGDLPKINNGGTGKVIGNVSGGDWICYTLDVADAGEYKITVHVSSDGARTLHFEVDGNAAGSVISLQGLGWDNYFNVSGSGYQFSEGKHVLKWVPSESMNIDYFIIERVGEYDGQAAAGPSFVYPRTSSYTGNPLFTDFTSPMFGSGFTGHLYTADPSAHVFDGTLYVYASHDMEPPQGCDRMDRYHVFSTTDLVNWTDHGEIMNAATSNLYTGTTGDGFMWAPDCAYNPHDGKYYFVYPHKINVDPATTDIPSPNEPQATLRWAHFLAVSDTPVGPFKCLGYIKGIPSTIDPCIFVDDDGEAYIFTSGHGHGCWGARLKKDNWRERDTEMVPMVGQDGTETGGFPDLHEAPYMIKRNGIYYLMHSDNNANNNNLRYSTAQNPLGPFTPQGVFMYPHGHDTHHNSLVEFNGKWYSFYHTGDYSARGNLRSVCFDEATFSADGKLNVVNTWGTPANGTPVAVSVKGEAVTIPASAYNLGGNGRGYFKREGEPGNGTISLGNEEWVRYSINVAEAGRYALAVKGQNASTAAKLVVSTNGDWRTSSNGVEWPKGDNELYIYPLNLPAGEQYIELRVKGGEIDIESFTMGRGQVNVPGTIEAEDLDPDNYYHKQFIENSNLKNTYRDDVAVAIATDNGITRIGNTSNGDYFTYTFNVTQEGRYSVDTYVAVGQNWGAYTLEFDRDTENAQSFSERFDAVIPEGAANGWGTYVPVTTRKVDLTEGVHTMRFTVDNGLNLDRFVFTRSGDLPIAIDPAKIKNEIPGTIIGGMIDNEDYYHKQFEGGSLKNDYKPNPDVNVRINGEGVIGNLSPGDYFTYYFKAQLDGTYRIIYTGQADTPQENAWARFKLIFDDDQVYEYQYKGNGWGNNVEVALGAFEF
ncbi:MAG: family 43 glycosylhydrolase, partial [Duncaniella sp.]|nr:family 43 glycosylhydrolase [Duncaniella sp.]